MENIAHLCTLPAQRIGYTHPRRLQALVTGLLTMAQDGLRKSPQGGTVYAHVRYLGDGAFAVSVKTQLQTSASSETTQELFSGVVMNLDDDEPAWTCRTGSLLDRVRDESARWKDTNRSGTGHTRRPDTPSQNVG